MVAPGILFDRTTRIRLNREASFEQRHNRDWSLFLDGQNSSAIPLFAPLQFGCSVE
jgi:hypothetical protein